MTAESKMLRTPRILVVDDDPVFRRMAYLMLSDKGFEVFDVDSGEEALRMAVSHGPDIILLDLSLSDMSGDVVCRRLREDKQTAHIPVIMVTAHDDSEDIEKAFDSGADSYILKPFEPQSLVIRIIQLLSVDSDAIAQNHQNEGSIQA